MKRTRRLSIEIEHRRLTFSLTRTAPPEPTAGHRNPSGDASLEPTPFPPACPQCGATWITVSANSGGSTASSANAVYGALQQHGLHLHVSPAGQLRICSKSFQEASSEKVRFEETKENL